jgi:hypothetical protein
MGNVQYLFFYLGKGPVDKACTSKSIPYFNSPSMPSFRMFDEEDDLGNFVEDPRQRRAISKVAVSSCPVERAFSVVWLLSICSI